MIVRKRSTWREGYHCFTWKWQSLIWPHHPGLGAIHHPLQVCAFHHASWIFFGGGGVVSKKELSGRKFGQWNSLKPWYCSGSSISPEFFDEGNSSAGVLIKCLPDNSEELCLTAHNFSPSAIFNRFLLKIVVFSTTNTMELKRQVRFYGLMTMTMKTTALLN